MPRLANRGSADRGGCSGLLPCLGRLSSEADIRLALGGGYGNGSAGFLGRSFYPVLSRLRRPDAGNQKMVGEAEEEIAVCAIGRFYAVF